MSNQSYFLKNACLKAFKLSLFVLIILLLSSCAYYNTFYNAKQYFESAQKKPLTNRNKPSSAAIEEYNKVIKKCGVILTDYKDSKWADDALFLLAKALYFRGNNEIQALEKADDLLKFYPDSPFIPEAHILIAKINYDLNKKADAFKMLQEFIQRAEFKEQHPKALVLISDYYIREKNYIDAQFYLRMITEKYSDSDEYPNAFYLLGKTLFDNEDYKGSLKVFTDLNSSRIDRSIKLSAQYYIAYNQFNLKQYDDAQKTIKKLTKSEFRESEIPKISILNARVLIEKGNYEKGLKELEEVIRVNPRTLYSAEAVFFIAETNFSKLYKYEDAISYYNRVKTEMNTSPLIEKAVIRSAIASQIIQLQRPNRELALDDLINEQLKLAEYFMYELDQPDSALAIYEKIPIQKNKLIELKDIYLQKSQFFSQNTHISFDSLFTDYNMTFNDTLKWDHIVNDSLKVVFQDSLTTNIQQNLERYEQDIKQYDEQYIPYTYFIQAVIYDHLKNDQTKVLEIVNYLNTNYADNRYTIALQNYLAGEQVDFLTVDEKVISNQYDKAMSIISDSLQTAIQILDDIADDDSQWGLKSNFTLGITYYIDLQDSVKAKPYLDKVLLKSPQSEYAQFINSFYDKGSFKLIDVLPAVLDIEKYEKLKAEALKDSVQVDSLNAVSSDSLNFKDQMKEMMPIIIEPENDSKPTEETLEGYLQPIISNEQKHYCMILKRYNRYNPYEI